MACYHPIDGYRTASGAFQTGKSGSTGLRMRVPCGRCIGCRLERSRQWAIRIMHEAQMHKENCFITLTYADEFLPPNGSLDREAFPLFMKRLRKEIAPDKVRYFHCGEYGEQFSRPHYHACIFGIGFDDRYRWTLRGEHEVFRSPTLERMWPFGNSEIGSLTFESAAYVARYVTKKVTGARAEDHYSVVDRRTGEIIEREPEYATMSRRPGIGRGWIERFGESDVFPHDEVIVRGHKSKPPRYYIDYLRSYDEASADRVSRDRAKRRNRDDETADRLQVREVCASARVNLFKRSYEQC